MLIDLNEIQARFGSYLWRHCRRYRGRVFDAEDIYQDVLAELATFDFRCKPTRCRETGDSLPYSPADVYRQIRCRVLSRLDFYALRCRKPDLSRMEDTSGTDIPRGTEALMAQVRELLALIVTEGELDVYDQLVTPDWLTWKIARDEKDEARADMSRLRMNVHNDLEIKGKHIAERLGISPATMSRRLKSVREAVVDAVAIAAA